MNESLIARTCGKCRHWVQFNGESRGECYRFPPVPSIGGTMMRPRVREKERACGEFSEGNGGVRDKVHPETVGEALKARRRS